MRFMGDAPLKGQSDLDVLCNLLKVSPANFARCPLSCSVVQFPHLSMSHRTLGWETSPMVQRGMHHAGGEGAGKGTPGLSSGAHPVLMYLVYDIAPRMSLVCNLPALLQLCGDHEVMRDECYCQVVKQITDNTSSKQDSCQRGWRLLYIVTAYHSCSEVLHPHLTRFLQDVSRTPGLPFQGIAKACEQNLQKTLCFGGRLELPSSIELRAMLAGRSSKRQLFLLPGGLERHLKIKTCTVALDVVEEICAEMALTRPEAFNEYVIFVVTNRGQHVCPLSRRAYILDVASEMEQVDGGYMLWFRRVLWDQPLKFENELYVTMHYNQVLPDYLKGLFSSVPASRPSEQLLQQVSKLASLQHRAKDHFYLPSVREVQEYIPAQLYRTTAGSTWLNLVSQHRQQTQALSPHQARAQFLELQQHCCASPLHPCHQPQWPQLSQHRDSCEWPQPGTAIATLCSLAKTSSRRSPVPLLTTFMISGIDGEVPPEGDPVDADPAAHGQLQLPLRGDCAGGRGGPAHLAAAAGAGTGTVSCGGRARGEPAQCP
uniref:MyTH4 domain-containing protein n=1 Tax=Pan paniscus TaxID=9597 RepID=A0A2R8ZV14_PANPA